MKDYFDRFFTLSLDLLSICDAEGRFIQLNPSWEKVLGIPAAEMLGRNFLDFVHPDDQHASLEAAQDLLNGGTLSGFENRYRCADGGWRWLMWSAVGSQEDGLIFAVARDLTERHNAESSRQRLSEMVEAMPDLAGFADPLGHVRYLNAAGRRLLGLSPEEPSMLLDLEDVHPSNSLRTLREVAIPHATQHGVWEGDTELLTRQGLTIPVRQTVIVHKSAGGEVEYLATLMRDLRPRLVYERGLREARVAAEAASQAKSVFLAQMSHELRTPLNAIIGFADLLLELIHGPLTPKQSRYVDNITTSGRHLLQLINDVLDLSKIEAGHQELAMAEVDLVHCVAEVLGVVTPLARKKEVRLLNGLPARLPKAWADVGRVRQILLNLLSNAIKFTGAGGRVEISATTDPTGWLILAVADTGIGIAPEHQERIFRSFEQVDAGYSRRQEGTGLGLALTRQLVEMHGGQLQVRSQVGEGSTFSFTLPSQEAVSL